MKFIYNIILFSAFIIFFPNFANSQRIDVDISSCRSMFNIFLSMKSGESKEQISDMLDSILVTKPYKIMFNHYNRSWRPNHLPPEVFKRMILSLQFKDEYKVGENQRADRMLSFWNKYYSNPGLFLKNINQIENADLKTLIERAIAFTKSWLPNGWKIPDFYIPIHPNGGSPAFAIEKSQGYDFFQIPKDSSGNINLNELSGIISHESHHLGLKTIYPDMTKKSDSLSYRFLSIFPGEGAATKFISNCPGGFVPIIDPSKKDNIYTTGEIGSLWSKYTKEEIELFKHLVNTFEEVYSGRISEQELQNEISKFWLSGFVSPVYFIGSELFGAIYFGFGKEGVFTAMKDLRQIFSLYNKSIKRRPDILGKCFVIPDSTVRHALSIGIEKR